MATAPRSTRQLTAGPAARPVLTRPMLRRLVRRAPAHHVRRSGFGDCDADLSNGCETPLNILTNCGACNTPCARANATASCATGTCSFSCATPASRAGCNGVARPNSSNAADLAVELWACGRVCPVGPHSTATCDGTNCGLTCDTGFNNCDNDPTTGCESKEATDVANCGGCGNDCADIAPLNSTPTCTGGECGYLCNPGFTDCGGACVDLSSDSDNCGSCGNVCPAGWTRA